MAPPGSSHYHFHFVAILLFAIGGCVHCQRINDVQLASDRPMPPNSPHVERARSLNTVEFVLGIYGPVTSVSNTFLASAVAFDLDFRKNFDTSLVTRFGPPIVSVANLNPNLRVKVQVGTSDSNPDTGLATTMDFMLGLNGLTKVNGVIGGYHSAIAMPVAALSAVLKVPQVAFGATSPKLTNKITYPFFSRTMPPDSLQAKAMWAFIAQFKVPAVSFIYARESYGEGLYGALADYAVGAAQAFRVLGIAIKYMPSDYDVEEARVKINQAKQANYKFIMLAMTPDQSTMFLSVIEQEGLYYTSDYQIIGSEAVKLAPSITPKPTGPLKDGFIRFNPIAKGPLFPKFEELWKMMTPDDVVGPAAVTRYSLDKMVVKLADGKAPMPTDSMFANLDMYQTEDPFLFDACYTFTIAFNEMLNSNIPAADIKGQALLTQVLGTTFEGISGTVAFNSVGDRLNSYTIDNIQSGSLVTVAVYSAATDVLVMESGTTMLWMSGHTGASVPPSLVACDAGFFEEPNTLLCRQCEAGSFSAGGSGVQSCQRCAVGKYAITKAATQCLQCGQGKHAAESGTTECKECLAGLVAPGTGNRYCSKCAAGRYQGQSGETYCKFCTAGNFSATLGSTS